MRKILVSTYSASSLSDASLIRVAVSGMKLTTKKWRTSNKTSTPLLAPKLHKLAVV